ncbi:MAG: hypothetical protein OES20_13690 [Gammaproteobacteria bacterium]|nr:hypothetical protein [Gammaproteobacteria bacterium]MDH3857208.1 hypothetical protein [Gammaproteobacteria bacterium]
MQENQSGDYLTSAERRKRTWRIVIAHVIIVATFFIATFFWGNFQ